MPATYDPSTDAGKVRLLCTDTDTANPIFSDEEIETFLTLESGDVRRAAAQALDTIGSSQVLVLKVIRLLDLQTDGAAVSRELRQRANSLREQVDSETAFDIAELVTTDFAARERINAEILRSQQ